LIEVKRIADGASHNPIISLILLPDERNTKPRRRGVVSLDAEGHELFQSVV
jgi:hypothetical protein